MGWGMGERKPVVFGRDDLRVVRSLTSHGAFAGYV